ncbi:MAG TPA: DUF1800 domain-containing protein [Chitinophagaceae bacterium]|nr:DUF1800 domain-containing protein [Chitinophagaceae bacterium]
MSPTNQLKNQHLMWRAGFGPAAEQLPELAYASPHALYKALRKASAQAPGYLDVADDTLKGLVMGLQEQGQPFKDLSADQKKQFQQQNRQAIRSLNTSWLREMVSSKAQLREKMAFFWHGHFACRNLNVFYQQELLDVIRRQALGNFRDLLHAVSKTAAMLNFLNNNQNRKNHPNENFAREVMELFTLGRGHYTESDVKESARAFTGWGANLRGEFVFRPALHDDGMKTVLGKTGRWDGDQVLDILLDQPQAARFVCGKLYRYFVNDQPDPARINLLADRFYRSGYDISDLMEAIFTSDWFYDPANIGTRIKSPIELIAGIQRMLPMELANEEALLVVQRLLGQVLFYPPNVAGWPGGRTWIDSSTLMMRMRLPQLLGAADEFNLTPKTDDDQMMGRGEDLPGSAGGLRPGGQGGGRARLLQATIRWEPYSRYVARLAEDQVIPGICQVLLQVPAGFTPSLISGFSQGGDRERLLRTATIQVMSTPEYQLC